TARTRWGPTWVGSVEVRGFIVLSCSVSDSGERPDHFEGFWVKEPDVAFGADRSDDLTFRVEVHRPLSDVIGTELFTSLQIPQITVVGEASIRSRRRRITTAG